MRMFKVLDPGSLVVMAMTLLLFVAAIFVKGMTHDLLLEAGVFLVSVKLLLMAWKNSVAEKAIQQELAELKRMIARLSSRPEDARP